MIYNKIFVFKVKTFRDVIKNKFCIVYIEVFLFYNSFFYFFLFVIFIKYNFIKVVCFCGYIIDFRRLVCYRDLRL